MFLVVLVLFSIYPAFAGRKRLPFELIALSLFILIYLGGMILLGGRGRHFIVAVPSLLLFTLFVVTRVLKIKIRKAPF